MEIKILPMAREHLAQVAQIEADCFSEPWSLAAFEAELENPAAVCFVALADGVVAGFGGMQTVLDEGAVTNVAVSEGFRGRGIGGRLVDALTRYAQTHGINRITLEVRAGNRPAIALYRSRGFLPVGRRKNFYRKPTEDADLMAWACPKKADGQGEGEQPTKETGEQL